MANLTYRDAGVNKEEGYQEVALIKEMVKRTYQKGVLSDLGGFSGLFEIDKNAYEAPVLVSGTDGVGTKVKLAQMSDVHNTVGIDCVAMCVNDILCQGAKPLFFLDYIATGKLVAKKMASIVEGIAEGCMDAGCALIGGETAEMPGIYKEDDYDVAGFCVGIVDKHRIIDGKRDVKAGDVILALPSSGIHSNGFSLVRKIVFDVMNFNLEEEIPELGKKLKDELLTPTRIYVKPVLKLLEYFDIHGLCHITGGGLYENVPRILSQDADARIEKSKIPVKKIFELLEKWGNIENDEMYGTFNMGVGMLLFVAKEDVAGIVKMLEEMGEEVFQIGEIVEGSSKVVLI